jgi:CRISPR-associated endonuclease Csn1
MIRMTETTSHQTFVLGLDLGVSSIGWAMIGTEVPHRIIRAGVHLFEAGVDGGKQDAETAMETGREKSRAMPRRNARQQRRQTWRRALRKRKILKALIRHGLFPEPIDRLASPADIDAYLKQRDAELRATWEVRPEVDHRTRQVLPYRLRAEALHRKLEPYEVGRAIYHLAQRRGFLSNRKTDVEDSADDDKNTGAVKKGISELDALMEAAGAETLGAYFASLDPSSKENHRIRGRWTARSMYEHEFHRIWDEQAKHHPDAMTASAMQEVRRAIFFQRPLKSQRHLIGRCSLITTKRRAPIADRLFQYFRMIQKVNDLAIIPCMKVVEDDIDRKTGEIKLNPKTGRPKPANRIVPDPTQVPRPLTTEERNAAIELLSQGDASFTKLRTAGAAPKLSRFNFENEGESKLPGLRTDGKLRNIFGERWDQLTGDGKDAVVDDCLSIVRADVMEKRGREHWQLSAENARAFARVKLEEGYANLSRAAMRKLLPELENGTRYATARKEHFPESLVSVEPVDELPPVAVAFDDPVSPAVARALSEMRSVVNAIIRRYGRPEHIRIEMARDLKKGPKRRQAISKNMADRRKLRESAAWRLLKEYPNRGSSPEDVSGTDILKVLLADECNWCCPYTGRCFGWEDVFGSNPTIDIEHTWPFTRSLDDSRINKTLCDVHENRNVKRNRMPSEVYSGDRFAEIIQRVATFKGDDAKRKLERFQAEAIPPDFTNRHLSESRYVSRKAAEYVALLYGGLSDEESTRRVHMTSGGLTAWLRREWGMNAILSDRNEKERDDHRHHAIDAIIVALTTASIVKKLQQSAARADEARSHRRFAGVEPPFDLEDARRSIEAIVVSHRQNKKARGKFHNDSIYSKPLPENSGKAGHRIRKELHKLNEKELDSIVDPRIRAVVRKAYDQRRLEGAKDPSQAFSEEIYRPELPHGDRVRRVRLFTTAKPKLLGSSENDRKHRGESKQRRVNLQNNHHTVIMARLDKDGKENTWVDEPVTMLEAMDRVRDGKPLISREVPEGQVFKFSLAANDYIEMDLTDGQGRAIYRILSVSKNDLEVASHTDGRTSKERMAAKERERVRGSSLHKRNARKVHINYLGEVKNAGG